MFSMTFMDGYAKVCIFEIDWSHKFVLCSHFVFLDLFVAFLDLYFHISWYLVLFEFSFYFYFLRGFLALLYCMKISRFRGRNTAKIKCTKKIRFFDCIDAKTYKNPVLLTIRNNLSNKIRSKTWNHDLFFVCNREFLLTFVKKKKKFFFQFLETQN